MKFDNIILALGNPGSEYELTRHNIGWLIADSFVESKKSEFVQEANYLIAALRYAGKNVAIIKPLTFMNLSGKAATKFIGKHGGDASKLVVISDEYNFPLGKIHLKRGGSAGGHNGLKSMITELGTDGFWRLRAGIGKDFGQGQLVDYVLSNFKESETEYLNKAIISGEKALEAIIKIGEQKAMPIINRKESENPET
ncbi:MAG: aminoacyl-tRNA hydrolase [Candidatus Kapaibacteriales bacterium]